jgi:hypothetical protein
MYFKLLIIKSIEEILIWVNKIGLNKKLWIIKEGEETKIELI